MNKIRRSRARGVRTRVVAAVMLLGLLAVAGGAARPVSAQPASSITIIPAQNPPTSATLSSSDQTTYVFYSLQIVSQSAWTHVVLSDTAPTVTPSGTGAAVVFADSPLCTIDVSGGYSCSIDKLAPNTPQTFSFVVRTPTSGTTLSVNPTVKGDERTSDSTDPQHQETPLSWTLTSDTTAAITSYTNPATTTGNASFHTNKSLCGASTCTTPNPQWTQADVPNGLAPLGVLVSLQERNFAAGDCPAFVASGGLHCFGQISDISVGSSGAGGVFSCAPPNDFPTSCANSLVFTVRVAAASLTSKVNTKKAGIFHNGVKVPFCSTGTTDTNDVGGDCTLSLVVDAATHDVIWSVEGASNGSWGGFG